LVINQGKLTGENASPKTYDKLKTVQPENTDGIRIFTPMFPSMRKPVGNHSLNCVSI